MPDCSAQLLSLFLRFLYGDHLDQTTLSNEQLIDLLIMADRFEVEQLSTGCQTVLTSRLDNSNVLCMLAIADQWSATQLQVKHLLRVLHNKISTNICIVSLIGVLHCLYLETWRLS